MSACRAYQIEDLASGHAANDNAPISARAKLKLHLAARWQFGSQYQISRHLYDGNLKRVKSFISDGKGYQTIYNIFDSSGKLVHIYNVTKNEKTEYVTGPTGTIARVTNGQEAGSGATGIEKVTYLHLDHLGSAQSGTDHTGNVVWREQYTPFGEQIQNPAANDFVAGCGPKSANFLFGEQKIREKGPAGLDGFTGHIKDKATGLNPCIFCSKNCTVQARYYDPVIGRFLSVDPVTMLDMDMNPGYFNRYAYTANDPINMIDPTGESFGWVVGLVEGTSKFVRKKVLHSKKEAVKARQKELNVELKDGSMQDATAIERAANNDPTKKILQHEGHKMKDGTTGRSHAQTNGKKGHTFVSGSGSSSSANEVSQAEETSETGVVDKALGVLEFIVGEALFVQEMGCGSYDCAGIPNEPVQDYSDSTFED